MNENITLALDKEQAISGFFFNFAWASVMMRKEIPLEALLRKKRTVYLAVPETGLSVSFPFVFERPFGMDHAKQDIPFV